MFSISSWTKRMMLAKQLKSAEASEREMAAQQLGEIGDPADIKILAAALKDEDMTVRKVAARSLRLMGDKRAVEPLMEGLADGTARGSGWQTEILVALEQYSDPRSTATCIQTLSNYDAKVRRAAATALGTIGDVTAVDSLLEAIRDEDAEVAHEAGNALAKIGQSAVKGLIQILADAPTQAKIAAVEALGVIGNPDAIEPMAATLKDKDRFLQIAVAKALARFNDPRVVAPLIEALEESASAAFFYGVRDEAETALAKMGQKVIPPLLEALQNPATKGRLFILKMLGDKPDPRSFQPLVEMLQDASGEIRKAAISALLKIDRKQTVGIIPPFLDDSDAAVRRTVGEALTVSGWQPETPTDRARFEIALGRYQQALNEGEEGVNLLLNFLQDPDAATRREVARTLGRLKEERFLQQLQVVAVGEREAEVQKAMIEAMEICGAPATESLVFLLEGGDWNLRRLASQSLARLGWQPQTAEQYTLYSLATGNAEEAAAMGEAALDTILQALNDPDPAVQHTATEALKIIRPGQA